VVFVQPDETAPHYPYAHWMPYQVAQGSVANAEPPPDVVFPVIGNPVSEFPEWAFQSDKTVVPAGSSETPSTAVPIGITGTLTGVDNYAAAATSEAST